MAGNNKPQVNDPTSPEQDAMVFESLDSSLPVLSKARTVQNASMSGTTIETSKLPTLTMVNFHLQPAPPTPPEVAIKMSDERQQTTATADMELELEVAVSVVVKTRKVISNSISNSPASLTCNVCEKSFDRTHHLKVHIKTVHERIKSFGCEKCPKRFGQKSHLKRHVKEVHLRVKEYSCESCNRSFAQRGNLLNHERTAHSAGKRTRLRRYRTKATRKST